MADLVFNYTDPASAPQTLTLNALRVKGFSSPDTVQLWPSKRFVHLDGLLTTIIKKFRRVIDIDLGVVLESADQLALLYWSLDTGRTLDYGTETSIAVELDNPEEFSNSWIDDSELGKEYSFRVLESTVRSSWPV